MWLRLRIKAFIVKKGKWTTPNLDVRELCSIWPMVPIQSTALPISSVVLQFFNDLIPFEVLESGLPSLQATQHPYAFIKICKFPSVTLVILPMTLNILVLYLYIQFCK